MERVVNNTEKKGGMEKGDEGKGSSKQRKVI